MSIPRQDCVRALAVVAVCVLPFSGCHSAPNADVLATVNGHAIPRSEVERMYAAQMEDTQSQAPSPEQANGKRLQTLSELINEEIVEQRAAKMNLTATNDEVDSKLAEMKAPYTEEQFSQRLKSSNLTLDQVKHDLRRRLTIDKLFNKEINSKITVSDADIEEYFSAHKAYYNRIEPVYHLAEIQVTSAPSIQPGNIQGSKASNDVEAKKKIQSVKLRLDSGEDFGEVAFNFSERPETASNRGDMGFITESQIRTDPVVFAAIMGLKSGQLTDILPVVDMQSKRTAGYAIYQLIGREPAGQRDLTDPAVQQDIRQQLHNARSQLLKSAYLEMLHDQARVENFLAEQIFKNNAR